MWGTLIGVIFGCGPYFAMRKLYDLSVEQTGGSTPRYRENNVVEGNASSRLYYTDLTNS